jgi:cytochrome c biogenesis protein CcmG/thiol:disulfide interchange protein DsbE
MTRISRHLWMSVSVFVAVCLHAQPSPSLLHKQAPEFAKTDLAGHTIDLKKFRGKVVLLNFWATWCAPCQVELPKFDQWQKKYGADGLQVVAVSMDDSEPPVRRTARRLHLDLPVVMGDAKLGEKYGGVLGLPVTFLIDRKGFIVAEFKGQTDLHVLEERVKSLLAKDEHKMNAQ